MQHVWLYTDLLQAWKGERLSSVFSPDGTLISAYAAPHCGLHQGWMRILVYLLATLHTSHLTSTTLFLQQSKRTRYTVGYWHWHWYMYLQTNKQKVEHNGPVTPSSLFLWRSTRLREIYTIDALPCHIYLPVRLWIMDPHSRAAKKIRALELRCYCRMLCISYKHYVTSK